MVTTKLNSTNKIFNVVVKWLFSTNHKDIGTFLWLLLERFFDKTLPISEAVSESTGGLLLGIYLFFSLFRYLTLWKKLAKHMSMRENYFIFAFMIGCATSTYFIEELINYYLEYYYYPLKDIKSKFPNEYTSDLTPPDIEAPNSSEDPQSKIEEDKDKIVSKYKIIADAFCICMVFFALYYNIPPQ